MTTQEINRIQTLLGSDYEVKQVGNVALIENKEEPIRVKVESVQVDPLNKIHIRLDSTKSIHFRFTEELKNHIEESIEAFLNRKP